MIKDTLVELVNNLNKLEPDSDTLIKIDWDNLIAEMRQVPNCPILLNQIFILFDESDRSGTEFIVLSSAKLAYLKQLLRRYINNTYNEVIIPGRKGFIVKEYSELLIDSNLVHKWCVIGEVTLVNPLILKLLLPLMSKNYRLLKITMSNR